MKVLPQHGGYICTRLRCRCYRAFQRRHYHRMSEPERQSLWSSQFNSRIAQKNSECILRTLQITKRLHFQSLALMKICIFVSNSWVRVFKCSKWYITYTIIFQHCNIPATSGHRFSTLPKIFHSYQGGIQ